MNAEKNLGIDPKLIERARKTAARVEATARALPPLVDRQLLILLPRERFFDWMNRWREDIKGEPLQTGTDRERWLNARSFLIPRMGSEKSALEFVSEHRSYFLESLVCGFSPRNRWPWVPNVSEFDLWFEVKFVDWGPWDLGHGEIQRLPDEMAAFAREI